MNANIQQIRDEWIALRCQNGDAEAFADLVRELERPLLYFACKLLRDEDKALDVLQDVWLKAFRSIRRLENPQSIRAWLYRLTRGLAVDRVRKDVAQQQREARHAEERPDAVDEPSFTCEDAAALHKALDTLEIRHREVLVLYFLEEMTTTEVGAILDCPAGTVKSRLYHAKRALHAALQGGKSWT